MACTTCQVLKSAARRQRTRGNPFGGRNVFVKFNRLPAPMGPRVRTFGGPMRVANTSACATATPWIARAVTG
jgi:hypothetical protein